MKPELFQDTEENKAGAFTEGRRAFYATTSYSLVTSFWAWISINSNTNK